MLSLAARKKRVDPTCSRYRWGRSHGAARAGPGPGKEGGRALSRVSHRIEHTLTRVREPRRPR